MQKFLSFHNWLPTAKTDGNRTKATTKLTIYTDFLDCYVDINLNQFPFRFPFPFMTLEKKRSKSTIVKKEKSSLRQEKLNKKKDK